MNEIIIQVHAKGKLSKKSVDIGNMQEHGVTKLIFELDEGVAAMGGNVYLFVSYDGETYPYPLNNNELEIGRELTQRKNMKANFVVSLAAEGEDVLSGVTFISDTLTMTVDKNNINIDSLNKQELPPSLQIVYDRLLNLEKDLEEKKASDYWRGREGPQGPQGNVGKSAYEYAQDGGFEGTEEDFAEKLVTEYVGFEDYATALIAGVGKVVSDNGITLSSDKFFSIARATLEEISAKASYYKPIVPIYLDYAVMKALTDPKNIAWDDIQRELALKTLGAIGVTDYAGVKKCGVMQLAKQHDDGLYIGENGELSLSVATNTNIANRYSKKVITPQNIDYAVMEALTTSKFHEWTTDEKASALRLLGLSTGAGVLVANGSTIGFVPWAYNNSGNSFVRRLGNGSIEIQMSDSNGCATTKKYVDENFIKSDIGAYKIPYTDGDGVIQNNYSWTTNNSPYTFALRRENGELWVGTPSNDNSATTKKYVDDLIKGLQEQIDALKG